MPPFHLVTLGGVALSGPLGPIALTDPRHLAVLVRLAATPARSLRTDEFLLAIWPHLTPERGTEELANAASAISRAAGEPLVLETAGRWTLAPSVECDLDGAPPSAAPSFAAGFCLPDTPEWDDWVAATRDAIARRPGSSRRRRRLRPAVALALAASSVGLGFALRRPRPVEGFSPGDRVVLADLEDVTPDRSLGSALTVAAAVGLREARRIELYSRQRVVESLRSLGQSLDSAGLTAERALEVAARDGVPWVVVIRVGPDGGRTRVTARLVRTETGQVVATASNEAAGMIDVVAAVGTTLRTLLVRFGEPEHTLRDQPALPFATTADVEALRAFTEGAAAWRRSEFHLARDHWHRAVTLDTGFALAMGSLGAYYYYHHDRTEGERFYREAIARSNRLTEWERLQLEERYAGWRGDRDSAVALSRKIAATFPGAGTWFDLGTALMNFDRCPEGLEALERSRRLDPGNSRTVINIATCERRAGRWEQARLAYLAAGRLDSAVLYRGNINLEFAGAVLLAGRMAEAESVLIRMSRQEPMADQALGFRGLGFLAVWRGRLVEAREQFRRAAAISRQQQSVISLLRNVALMAATQRTAGERVDPRSTLAVIDSLAELPMAPDFLGLAVEVHAEEGNVRKVRALVDRIRTGADPRNRADSLLVHYVTGTLALAAGDARVALAALGRAEGFIRPISVRLRQARAYQQLGQLDSARLVLAPAVARPVFGFEDQLAQIRAMVEIGLVEERLGRSEEAVASYRRFLEHWKDADPGLPDVVLIRARLDTLLGRRDR